MSYTMSKEDLRTIHNALCDLQSVQWKLEEVLNPEIFKQLSRAASNIRSGFADVRAHADNEWQSKHDLFDAAREQHGFSTVWSIYEAELDKPHPFTGATWVQYLGKKSVVMGTTWLDLWRAADTVIKASGDKHHIFIEEFRQRADMSLDLTTGS